MAKAVIVMVAARGGDDREVSGKQPVGGKAVERGQQHALRKIAGRAEQEELLAR